MNLIFFFRNSGKVRICNNVIFGNFDEMTGFFKWRVLRSDRFAQVTEFFSDAFVQSMDF